MRLSACLPRFVALSLRALPPPPRRAVARAARADLVSMGAALVRFNWEGFRVVCENVNGLTGACEDSGDADPFCE